jgi:hypothetical protein
MVLAAAAAGCRTHGQSGKAAAAGRVAGIASFVRAVDQTASTTMVDLDLVVTMDSAIARPVGATGIPTCTHDR